MPKKRFSTQYSKPPSTVHPSLSSTNAASLDKANNASLSVNDLISSSRKSAASSLPKAASIVTTHTLPPQIRNLLALPETPAPRPRRAPRYRSFDADGHRLPAGPAPPRSWLENSRWAPRQMRGEGTQRKYPTDTTALPGYNDKEGRRSISLQNMCLRTMAREWEFVSEYERNNLWELPSAVRSLLLSNIAIYGPDNGIPFENLKDIFVPPKIEGQDDVPDFDAGKHNADFWRLDLSGSMGHSIRFARLAELFEKPSRDGELDQTELDWEECLLVREPSAPIPHITHLSLSHPSSTISWSRLIAFTKHLPSLTHLSLAYWPIPSLTPNFSGHELINGELKPRHTMDYGEFKEAAGVLRSLALALPRLEWLDLSGNHWISALLVKFSLRHGVRGIDWSSHWLKLHTLVLNTGTRLHQTSGLLELSTFLKAWESIIDVEDGLRREVSANLRDGKIRQWIDVIKDDVATYEDLWKSFDEKDAKERIEMETKRKLLDKFMKRKPGWRSMNRIPGVSLEMEHELGEVEGLAYEWEHWERLSWMTLGEDNDPDVGESSWNE